MCSQFNGLFPKFAAFVLHRSVPSISLISNSTKDTHQLAEANQQKNDKLREAFGLSEFYVDGSSFDPNRKHKELEAKAKAMAQKSYQYVSTLLTSLQCCWRKAMMRKYIMLIAESS
mgnify:CR=1 FL=1